MKTTWIQENRTEPALSSRGKKSNFCGRIASYLHYVLLTWAAVCNKNWGNADLENPTKFQNESRHNR